MKRTLACFAFLVVAGCPKQSVVIYRSLSQPGAMETCDANQQFHFEVKGADEASARANGEAQMQQTVESNKGCGALIVNDAAGKNLDGTYTYAGNFQFCRCK